MLADFNLAAEVVREIASRVAAEGSAHRSQTLPWLTPQEAADRLRLSVLRQHMLDDMAMRGVGARI